MLGTASGHTHARPESQTLRESLHPKGLFPDRQTGRKAGARRPFPGGCSSLDSCPKFKKPAATLQRSFLAPPPPNSPASLQKAKSPCRGRAIRGAKCGSR